MSREIRRVAFLWDRDAAMAARAAIMHDIGPLDEAVQEALEDDIEFIRDRSDFEHVIITGIFLYTEIRRSRGLFRRFRRWWDRRP